MKSNKARKHDIFDERQSQAAYIFSAWRGKDASLLELPPRTDSHSRPHQIPSASASEELRAMMRKLCEAYPGIAMSPDILGGEPHIKGTRLSVAHVIAYIYHLGSVDAVIKKFHKTHISGDQIKEALKYAHDFMEIACDPSSEDDD